MKIYKIKNHRSWWGYKDHIDSSDYYSYMTTSSGCWDLWIKAAYIKNDLTYYWYEIK